MLWVKTAQGRELGHARWVDHGCSCEQSSQEMLLEKVTNELMVKGGGLLREVCHQVEGACLALFKETQGVQ